MQRKPKTPLAEFIRIASWPTLLAGLFLYALGAGIVHFRGEFFDWRNFWLGSAIIVMLLLSCSYLTEYYSRLQAPPPGRANRQNHGDPEPDVSLARGAILLAAVTALTVGTVMTVLLITGKTMNLTVFLVLGIALVLVFAYAVPPFRLVYSGYGELVMAVLLTNLFPALGFLLQTGEMTNLLGMLTFPLTALYLAMALATSLESYFSDIKEGRQNMMIRLGWQRGIVLHNVLIMAAYLLVGIGSVVGMAWVLTWPKLLTLPIAIFQIYQIWLIGRGAKPRWNLLKITAIATFALSVYFQTFTLWIG